MAKTDNDEKTSEATSAEAGSETSVASEAESLAKGAANALATFRATGHMPSGFVYNSQWPEKVRSVAKAKRGS